MDPARLMGWLRRVLARSPATAPPNGQGLVEYALILVLVVLVVFVVVVWLGPWVGNTFSNVIVNL